MVAIAVGRPGIDSLLIGSQVALAIVLPFVAAPLIWLTSSKSVMSVRKPAAATEGSSLSSTEASPTVPTPDAAQSRQDINAIEEVYHVAEHSLGSLKEKRATVLVEKQEHRLDDIEELSFDDEAYVSFAIGWVVTGLAYLIFFIILAANMYAIVMLAMGRTS